MLHLLPKLHSPAHTYGLPKIHKPNVPLRPIVSGTGSLLHNLAGKLAKSISCKVGTVSNHSLKHSGDLISTVKDVSMRNKQLASFDVVSLFTNVPREKAMDVLKSILTVNDDLPLPLDDFLELIDLCISNCCFSFNNNYFKQMSGMSMGSPISPILANLFLEHLETTRLFNIVPREVLWFRYVDDILVLAPRRLDLGRILDQKN